MSTKIATGIFITIGLAYVASLILPPVFVGAIAFGGIVGTIWGALQNDDDEAGSHDA